MALSCLVTDRCIASVQAARKLIISSSLQVIAWNKHEWTSEGILFQPWKDVNTQHFLNSSPPTLIWSPIWFVCWTKKADSASWLVRSPVNQTPGEGSIIALFFFLEYYKYFDFMSIKFKSVGPKTDSHCANKKNNFSKYLFLCSTEERKHYLFGMTWGWINDDRIFFLLFVICVILVELY